MFIISTLQGLAIFSRENFFLTVAKLKVNRSIKYNYLNKQIKTSNKLLARWAPSPSLHDCLFSYHHAKFTGHVPTNANQNAPSSASTYGLLWSIVKFCCFARSERKSDKSVMHGTLGSTWPKMTLASYLKIKEGTLLVYCLYFVGFLVITLSGYEFSPAVRSEKLTGLICLPYSFPNRIYLL